MRALSGSGALPVLSDGTKNVLIIDGTGMSGDFMSDSLLLKDSPLVPREHQHRATEASWRGLKHEQIGLEGGERPDRLELCQRAIASGRFHSIILSDLSEDDRAVPAVE